MAKRYDEIMKKIEVDEEMRSRILENIQKETLSTPQKRKTIPFPLPQRYLSIAACLAVIILGATFLPHIWNRSPHNVSVGNYTGDEIKTVSSLEELIAATGLDLNEITELPFPVREITYTSYWNQMAEITYFGEEQTITFRKSADTEDNSGDYSAYEICIEKSVNGTSVTLKGSQTGYSLVCWQKDNTSYSLRFEEEVSEETCLNLFQQIE